MYKHSCRKEHTHACIHECRSAYTQTKDIKIAGGAVRKKQEIIRSEREVRKDDGRLSVDIVEIVKNQYLKKMVA